MIRRRDFVAGAAAVGVAATLPRHALASDPGVGGGTILFGQVAAFEGPASALGLGMREGITAAFAEANETGGVNGRRLELVSRDDGYEPAKSAEATSAKTPCAIPTSRTSLTCAPPTSRRPR